MLQTAGGMPGSWTQDRNEQARHYTGWVYVAIRAIAKTIAGAQPQVGVIRRGEDLLVRKRKGATFLSKHACRKALASVQDNEEIEPVPETHPLVQLLRNPNKPDTAYTFFFRMSMWLRATGNTYIWISEKNALGHPLEMFIIPSNWIWPCKGSLADPTEYEVRPRASYMGGQAVRIPGNDIIHVPYPGLLDPFDGFAPLSAGARWVDISESIDRSQWATFKNGVNSKILIELDKDKDSYSEEIIARFKARFRTKYQGEDNAGEPIVMEPGAKVVPMGNTPVEMDYINSSDAKRDEILALYGVSKSIVGMNENINRATADAAIANFVYREVCPDMMLLGQVLTEKLASRFDPSLVVYWPDLTPDDPEMELRKMQAGQAALAVTPNEWREYLGMEKFPKGGDDPMGPMGMVPYPFVSGAKPVQSLPMPDRYNGGDPNGNGLPDPTTGKPGQVVIDNGATKPNRDPFGVTTPSVDGIKVAGNRIRKLFSTNGHK